jgi:hypothetical protein
LLVQQVLDALRDTKTESHTIKKYLPHFLDKLREDLVKELRGERELKLPPFFGQVVTPRLW